MLKNGVPPTAASITLKVIFFVLIVYSANLCYGFAHEAAHALVIKTLGGQVYEIHVNLFGTDAYTAHSAVTGTAGIVSLELAGMAVTTALAFFTLLSDYAPIPVFIAIRTAIYALNYSPGTDISTVQQVLGNGSFIISLLLVALNLACAAVAIGAVTQNASIREPVLERFLHF
ncbi:MAG TPA: hypothetical protein VMC61_04515 [Methanocella sp.]|nr:hypothetical protein [Methanocella sp.]